MKLKRIDYEFVELIPSPIEEGVLYISLNYATASHLCACGCGTKVVTPISPAEWKLSWDGESVSLAPSIGNWEFPCRSHYWIRDGRIRWARQWTDREIERGRRHDEDDLATYFAARGNRGANEADEEPPGYESGRPELGASRWRRLLARGKKD